MSLTFIGTTDDGAAVVQVSQSMLTALAAITDKTAQSYVALADKSKGAKRGTYFDLADTCSDFGAQLRHARNEAAQHQASKAMADTNAKAV